MTFAYPPDLASVGDDGLELAATPLERALAESWAEVLGVSPIGRHDRFVDLGGTSLAAEKVLVLLRRRLAIDIGAEVLVGAPTLAEIAERIECVGRARFLRRSPAHRRLTQPAQSASYLHCFAGAGAGVVSFLGVSALADAGRTVIAYQAHGLESRSLPSWSVATHARRHLKQVVREQPVGPYVLMGHSFGGHIAVEVARLLEARGEQVTCVVLLDTVLRNVHAASVADYGSRDEAIRRPGAWQRLVTHARIACAGLVRFSPPVHQAVMWEQGIRVQNRHQPEALPAYARVLVSDENAGQYEQWVKQLAVPEQVQRIAGSHLSVLSDPHALARVFDVISAAEQSDTKEVL